MPAMPINSYFTSNATWTTSVRRSHRRDADPIRLPRLTVGLLGALLLAMVYLGVYPAHLMGAIQHASDALFVPMP